MIIKEKYCNGYYREVYNKLLEEINSTKDVAQRNYYIKKIYYYKEKAGISSKEYQADRYRPRIDELKMNILVVELLRREAQDSYGAMSKSPLYNKIESLNSQNRSLYFEIKKAVPDFESLESFSLYRDNIIRNTNLADLERMRKADKYIKIQGR